MRKAVLLLASMVAALVLARVVALVVPKEQVRAAFPGINSRLRPRLVTGRFPIFASEGGEIYKVNVDEIPANGSNEPEMTFLTSNRSNDPAFSPGGGKIASQVVVTKITISI